MKKSMGDLVADDMLKVISSKDHQHLFYRKAKDECCPPDCDCKGSDCKDSCDCCKKEQTKSAENILSRTFSNLLEASQILEDCGFDKLATRTLNVLSSLNSKLEKKAFEEEDVNLALESVVKELGLESDFSDWEDVDSSPELDQAALELLNNLNKSEKDNLAKQYLEDPGAHVKDPQENIKTLFPPKLDEGGAVPSSAPEEVELSADPSVPLPPHGDEKTILDTLEKVTEDTESQNKRYDEWLAEQERTKKEEEKRLKEWQERVGKTPEEILKELQSANMFSNASETNLRNSKTSVPEKFKKQALHLLKELDSLVEKHAQEEEEEEEEEDDDYSFEDEEDNSQDELAAAAY